MFYTINSYNNNKKECLHAFRPVDFNLVAVITFVKLGQGSRHTQVRLTHPAIQRETRFGAKTD